MPVFVVIVLCQKFNSCCNKCRGLGWEPGSNGGEKYMGGGRREGGRWDTQGVGVRRIRQ